MMKPIPPKKRLGLTRSQLRDLRSGLLFISPWIIGFCAFLAYPIVMSIYFSLCDFSVLQPPQFVGLANYRQLFQDDVFLQALSNTFVYALAALPLGIMVAFCLALLLNTGVRGMAFYRTIFFLPSLVPAVALAILWLWLFNGKSGILNYAVGLISRPVGLLLLLGALASPALLGWALAASNGRDERTRGIAWGVGAALGGLLLLWCWRTGALANLAGLQITPPDWLNDTFWVKPALVFMSLWGVGNAMVIYLAGLQDVPVHLYEAADLDGVNWMQKIRHVTLPMMSPVLLFNGIMGIIGTFNYFAIPYIMAPGGKPARSAYFLAVNLYDNAFQYLRMGYASAMAWILFIIVFALTMAAMKLSEKHVHYGGG
jgi:multiple sugar transport system permease protein